VNAELKLEWAQRLINIVCGENYGDGEIVTDVGMGYAEPGYHNNNTVWVLGNWNDKARFDRLKRRIKPDTTPSRLFDALERIGVEGEWLDEWYRCSHCYRIVRCSGDSYMWKPFYVQLEDGDVLCGECVLQPDFLPDVLQEYINNSDKAVTFCGASVLEEQGWVRYNDNARYQAGLHPGMNDRPGSLLEMLKVSHPEHDVLFLIDETSQFYMEFSAFLKPKENDE